MNVLCPHCKTTLQGEPGEPITCTTCAQRLRVPAPKPAPMAKWVVTPPVEPPPAPKVEPEPPVLPAPKKPRPKVPVPVRVNYQLIRCHACGRSIATQAPACPGCGAPNEWVHPEIRSFLQRLQSFGIHGLRVQARGCILRGNAPRSRGFLGLAGDLVGSMAFFGPSTLGGIGRTLAASMAAGYVGKALRDAAGPNGEAFIIDFRIEPPAWRTTNDQFWEPVLDYFDL